MPRLTALAVALFYLGLSGQSPKPALPHYDWNACPGEGCTYGTWISRTAIPVFATYNSRSPKIAQLKADDRVTALTGVVITRRPGVIRVDRDFLEGGLQRGDSILIYAYRGEGNSAVWFKNQYFATFDISFVKWPDGSGCGGDRCAATYPDLGEKAWWAKVKLSSGAMGWVDMDRADFAGSCLLSNASKKLYAAK